MYKINALIKGVAPIRFHRFIDNGKNTTSRKKMTDEEEVQEALLHSYKDENGFYVPAMALRACIINGAKKVKVGKYAASKIAEAIFRFEKDKFYFSKHDDYKIMQDIVRIPPKTGARVPQKWVILENWELPFSITVLEDTFQDKAVEEAIHYAGLYYGLLDGRPMLGTFTLEKFERVKEKK
jgi:hypothetical protein